jgi:hypothetical protein
MISHFAVGFAGLVSSNIRYNCGIFPQGKKISQINWDARIMSDYGVKVKAPPLSRRLWLSVETEESLA